MRSRPPIGAPGRGLRGSDEVEASGYEGIGALGGVHMMMIDDSSLRGACRTLNRKGCALEQRLTEELGIYAATVAGIVANLPPGPERARRVADSARAMAIRMGHLGASGPVPGIQPLREAVQLLETEICGLCALESGRASCALGRPVCWAGFSFARGRPLPLVA